jgi:SAM-dependent methyltransferase
MSAASDSRAPGYDSAYAEFDSPLMRRLRSEAYGEDIGQHSWVTAEELRGDIARLRLSPASRLVDLGCGPCGPLTFVVQTVVCRGTGIEQSERALEAGRARAAALGIEHLVTLQAADLNERPLVLASDSFDAALSLDVVLHLRDRAALFREVARILAPGGRFLFTDAGVLTGSISSDEVARRSVHGYTQFSAPGFNERMLERAGLRLLESEDRTESALRNAKGRRAARLAHRKELETLEGANEFARQQEYLETVIALSERGAVSRMMYLAERPGT